MTIVEFSTLCYRIKAPDKLRLAMLYALRYEDTGNLRAVKSRLLDSGLAPEKVDLLDALLQYSGVSLCVIPHAFSCFLPNLTTLDEGSLREQHERTGGRFGCLSPGKRS